MYIRTCYKVKHGGTANYLYVDDSEISYLKQEAKISTARAAFVLNRENIPSKVKGKHGKRDEPITYAWPEMR